MQLTQLCLRGRDLKAQFEEIMNPIWLSLKIPPGYTEIISKNFKEQNEHKKREKNNQQSVDPTDNYKKYGTEFSRQKLLEYIQSLSGNNWFYKNLFTNLLIYFCSFEESNRVPPGSWNTRGWNLSHKLELG